MSTYPAALDSFERKGEGPGNYLYASDINGIFVALEAIQGTLGVDPAGANGTVGNALTVFQTNLTNIELTPGPTGPTGADGRDGQPRFVGSGPPTGGNTVGAIPGDRYLDETTGTVYVLA